MDQLEREDLKNSMESLLSTLKCPVCFLLLDKKSTLCTNGHAICSKCKVSLQSCPTCRCSFSNLQQNVVFSQVVEILPHPCRFDKCSYLVKPGDDHEVYCRYRPTQCEFSGCKWLGSVDNLPFHLEDKHSNEKIYSAGKNLKFPKHYFESTNSSVVLFSACGHYFWQCTYRYHPANDLVCFAYIPVFVGKPTRDLYARIWFKSEEKELFSCGKIKTVQVNDVWQGDAFFFPASTVSNFYDGNELKYHLLITEERNDAANLTE